METQTIAEQLALPTLGDEARAVATLNTANYLWNSWTHAADDYRQANNRTGLLGIIEKCDHTGGTELPNVIAAIREYAIDQVNSLDGSFTANFPEPSADGFEPTLQPGTYTVSFPDGGYETVKVTRGKTGFFAGKLVFAYLSGPDNETCYTGFGHAEEGKFKLWKRFERLGGSTKMEAARVLLFGNQQQNADRGAAYAEKSGRCYNCGRTLTVPTSIYRGLGPECASRLGVL